MKIAVEGCCHGELDKIYETITHIEKRDNIKVGSVLEVAFAQNLFIEANHKFSVPNPYLCQSCGYGWSSKSVILC